MTKTMIDIRKPKLARLDLTFSQIDLIEILLWRELDSLVRVSEDNDEPLDLTEFMNVDDVHAIVQRAMERTFNHA